MEFILEFVLGFWFEMATCIVPSKDNKKKGKIAKIIVLAIIIYVIIAFTVGSIMLSDNIGSKVLAAVLITSSIVIFLLQIILGIIFYIKKKKK